VTPLDTTAEVLAEAKGLPVSLVEAKIATTRSDYAFEVRRSLATIDAWTMEAAREVASKRSVTERWLALAVFPHDELGGTFRRLVERWRNETLASSTITMRSMHPSYQRIIGLGPAVIPLILGELQRRPDHWFWALNALTGEQPVPEGAGFDQAVETWLSWGRRRNLM